MFQPSKVESQSQPQNHSINPHYLDPLKSWCEPAIRSNKALHFMCLKHEQGYLALRGAELETGS